MSTKKEQPSNDLGLGTKIVSLQRFIRKDGSFNVTRRGVKGQSYYQNLVEESWRRLLFEIVFYYLVINLFFAIILVGIGVDSISGLSSQSFGHDLMHAFFFSVQTFTTVGYGAMSPVTIGAHFLSALIAFVGLLSFALATSLIYSRFSKPKAQIIFSQKAVVCKYKDTTALMFRIVNKRNHKINDLEAEVFATWIEYNNNTPKRIFAKLELERRQIFLFPMNWTIVHPLAETSPLFNKTKEQLSQVNLEIIVQLKGYDESYNQTVHANASYITKEIIWGERFAPMVTSDEDGTVVWVDRIDDRMEDK